LREIQPGKKAAPENLKPPVEPLNRGTTDAAQVALPQSLILRRSEGRLPDLKLGSASAKSPLHKKPNFEPTIIPVLIQQFLKF
jgi:hypothetical protein